MFGTLAVCAVVDALVAYRRFDPERPVWFVVSSASVVVAVAVTAVAARVRTGSLRRLAISPFALAAGTWLVLFVLRPLELYYAPDHAAIALSELGFRLADLTRTNAIAGLGCAAWCAGYLIALGPRRDTPEVTARWQPLHISARGATVALALGTLLWGSLFIRQGGPSALLHSAASIRVNEGSSFYAFVGVWIVQASALYAFAAHLQRPTRASKRVLATAVALSLAAGLCLQLRSLTVFTVIGAFAIYLTLRVPSRRAVALGVVLLALGVLALGVTQELRALTATHSTRESIQLTARTPLWAMYVSDLSTYDNLVAMQGLVPDSIPYLDGRTLAEIPAALVPRSLWPGKPLGIDFRVSSYLYPGVFVGIPITVQGELYWNGGIGIVALGALILGAALGRVARMGLSAASGAVFVFYAVTLPFTHGLLTRGLAGIVENLVFALVGTAIAVTAIAGLRPSTIREGVTGYLNLHSRSFPRIGDHRYAPPRNEPEL